MEECRIYFNPGCSKCRAGLELLGERGVEAEVVEYLRTPPTAGELRELVGMLGVSPRELVRTGEEPYERLGLAEADDDALIEAMAENPILIQRPIVVKDGKAVIGRPPERILDLL